MQLLRLPHLIARQVKVCILEDPKFVQCCQPSQVAPGAGVMRHLDDMLPDKGLLPSEPL